MAAPMAGEFAILGGAVGLLLLALLPMIIFLVALWRMGTAQQKMAGALMHLVNGVNKAAHSAPPPPSAPRGEPDDMDLNEAIQRARQQAYVSARK